MCKLIIWLYSDDKEPYPLPYPWFNYRSYHYIDVGDKNLNILFTPNGTAWTHNTLEAIKYYWDSMYTQDGVEALMPITSINPQAATVYTLFACHFTAIHITHNKDIKTETWNKIKNKKAQRQ